MTTNSPEEHTLIDRLTQLIEANLTNNQFGVSELAKEIGMSRSSLHRHLKSSINLTTSQFICKVRLEKGMEFLRKNSDSASEVAYNVGFSSPAYFSRCFHNYYGYPPGEVKKRFAGVSTEKPPARINPALECEAQKIKGNQVFRWLFIVVLAILAIAVAYQLIINESLFRKKDKDLSIIVLPFENLSHDPGNESFADGIREDILNNLYWITALRVVSRTSAEQFRGSTLSSQEIARKMKVRYVLEGSVRRDGDKVRISIQLIDSYIEDHLWSSFFDRTLDNIIGVQDEIALKVASSLKAVLSENEIQKIQKTSTQNAKAYDYYLQARFLLHQANSEQRSDFDKKAVMNCIQFYEKAIAEDENFAEAYAGLANAWLSLSAWGWLPGGFPKARELSKKALEIDPECAEAHAVLGTFLVWGIRNMEEGGKALKHSVQLNPNFGSARQWYAQYLMITGPIEDARLQINYALELEPYFWVILNLNSWIYYFEEKYDKALEACKVARHFKPNYSDNEWLFVLNYAKLGEGEKLVQQLQTIAKNYSGTDKYSAQIQEAYNQAGIKGLFAWLIELNKNNPIQVQGMNGHPFFIAWWNAMIGNKEEAIFWLEKNMLEKRIPYHYFNLIATNPDFDILRDDPRFLKIIDDIGLTPYHKRGTK